MRWKSKPKLPSASQPYWQDWFAWHPVTLEDTGERVWLETIWRNITTYGGGFGYVVYEARYHSKLSNPHEPVWP